MRKAILRILLWDRPPTTFEINILPLHGENLLSPLCGDKTQLYNGRNNFRLLCEGRPNFSNLFLCQNSIPLVFLIGTRDTIARVEGHDVTLNPKVEHLPDNFERPRRHCRGTTDPQS